MVVHEVMNGLSRYSFRYDQVNAMLLNEFLEDADGNSNRLLRDRRKPYSVRYDQVNAMLLNEFLKSIARSSKSNSNWRNNKRDRCA